jgi:SWIM zinc finger
MVIALGDVFRSHVVEGLAGARVHARGVRYFEDGRVVHEADGGERVRAIVKGTVPYVVELWADDGGPAWSCSCPAAEDGAFCKHCVAVALTLQPEPEEEPEAEDEPAGRPRLRVVPDEDDDGDIERYVSGLPQETLAKIVLGQARMDRRLYKRLASEARVTRP